jgi:hypothetical protein
LWPVFDFAKSKNAFEKGPFLLVRFLSASTKMALRRRWANKENEQINL